MSFKEVIICEIHANMHNIVLTITIYYSYTHTEPSQDVM
jgi:hypothetical protein